MGLVLPDEGDKVGEISCCEVGYERCEDYAEDSCS